ncbi:MAG: hypothetical protein DRK00_09410 [Thermoprotei archaeon]|nr:MAG: hypothetical protein DRK00_09410 [Thermoprotei archaeon]
MLLILSSLAASLESFFKRALVPLREEVVVAALVCEWGPFERAVREAKAEVALPVTLPPWHEWFTGKGRCS